MHLAPGAIFPWHGGTTPAHKMCIHTYDTGGPGVGADGPYKGIMHRSRGRLTWDGRALHDLVAPALEKAQGSTATHDRRRARPRFHDAAPWQGRRRASSVERRGRGLVS